MSWRIFFVALAATLVFQAAVGTVAGGTEIQAANLYLTAGGGTAVSIAGINDQAEPTIQLGVGVRWKYLSIDANFTWGTLAWGWEHSSYCIDWIGAGCSPTQVQSSGREIGGLVFGRLFPFGHNPIAEPYLLAGLGALEVSPEGMDGFDDSADWALVFRGGGGIELALGTNFLALDLEVAYSLLYFQRSLDLNHDVSQGIQLLAALKLYL